MEPDVRERLRDMVQEDDDSLSRAECMEFGDEILKSVQPTEVFNSENQ